MCFRAGAREDVMMEKGRRESLERGTCARRPPILGLLKRSPFFFFVTGRARARWAAAAGVCGMWGCV